VVVDVAARADVHPAGGIVQQQQPGLRGQPETVGHIGLHELRQGGIGDDRRHHLDRLGDVLAQDHGPALGIHPSIFGKEGSRFATVCWVVAWSQLALTSVSTLIQEYLAGAFLAPSLTGKAGECVY
jgi:hypothetical protein